MIISNAITTRITVAEKVPVESNKLHAAAPPPVTSRITDDRVAAQPTNDAPTVLSNDSTDQTEHESPDLHKHFQRGSGAYPLRNRSPTALLTVREIVSNPDVHARNTGCAFVAHSLNADPKTRKQALRDDRA
eukprot:3116523-Pleurochrysis_carterae.AAC.1